EKTRRRADERQRQIELAKRRNQPHPIGQAPELARPNARYDGEQRMSQRLIYIMDPMCSWCWGFAPVLDALQSAHPQLPLHLVVGGLRPGVTDPLSEATRRTLGEHWQAVGRTSGQPLLTPDALPDGFIYNTEPACRAL